jgi:hypothetical protein
MDCHARLGRRTGTLLPMRTRLVLVLALVAGCGGGSSQPPAELTLDVRFDGTQVSVIPSRALVTGEELHLRAVREPYQPGLGSVDCTQVVGRHPARPSPSGDRLLGPLVDFALAAPFYEDQAWLRGPTPEMLASLAAGVDVRIQHCLVKDGAVIAQGEIDLVDAWDAESAGQPTRHLHGPRAYAEACVAELGEIPFFTRHGAGDYGTFDCRDGTVVPMAVTDANGVTTYPTTAVDACDAPQYLDGSCEPGARLAVQKNDMGTRWALLCRKAADVSAGRFNDIALLGHNPLTGKTCFFQNALFYKTDGAQVPHPLDRVRSSTLWHGVHGGQGEGLDCVGCHDADAWIHTPWIDGARDQNDKPLVPKLGVDLEYGLGQNDAPYSIVNRAGQEWAEPRHIVAPEAEMCTACHRIGTGQWLSWLGRFDGEDADFLASTTPAYRTFEKLHWMPMNLGDLTAETWPESTYARAIAFLKGCLVADETACPTVPIPTEPPMATGDTLWEPVDLPEIQLAQKSLRMLGGTALAGSEERCTACHSITRNTLDSWRLMTAEALGSGGCLDPGLQPLAATECMRQQRGDASTPYFAARVGVLSTAAHLGWFQQLFRDAYATDPPRAIEELGRFKAQVAMPRGNHPRLTQDEVNLLVTWFTLGIPHADVYLPDEPPLGDCVPGVTQALRDHVTEMATSGWATINQERNLRMFGCPAGATTPLDCLTSFPAAGAAAFSTGWGEGGSTIRLLRTLNFNTNFWTRSSADGRFVANGGGPAGATITDLERAFDIPVDAGYDPGFFPDNSGFVFQGGGGTPFCTQDLLESNPSAITFDEPECRDASFVSLYQHLGVALDGGDYFAVAGPFASDSGGSDDSFADFTSSSQHEFTPLINNGTHFVDSQPVYLDTPYEGDGVVSPSTRLFIGRRSGDGGRQDGFTIRKVTLDHSGGFWTVDAPVVATVCEPGGKPAVSFDERYMVYYHKVEQHEFADYGFASLSDPAWQAYWSAGTGNLHLVDLMTGTATRITRMHAGQYAEFPHFRSDGWIYFLVIDTNTGRRYLAASDAAL